MGMERNHMLVAPATVKIGGTSIGTTSGPSSFVHTIETIDIEGNQSHETIKSVKNAERGRLSFGALEITRENLKLFFETSQAIETDGNHKKVHIGGDQDISEHEIVMYSRAEDDKLRKFTFRKCVRDGDVEYTMDKSNPTVLNLSYKMLADLTKAEGKQLFEIDDDTATAYDMDTGL